MNPMDMLPTGDDDDADMIEMIMSLPAELRMDILERYLLVALKVGTKRGVQIAQAQKAMRPPQERLIWN